MGKNFCRTVIDERPEWTIIPGKTSVLIKDHLATEVWQSRPDAILNFASKVGPEHSFKHPAEHLAVNLKGTINLLEVADYASIKRFYQISSCEVYGLSMDAREDGPLSPISPYGKTKAGADFAVLSSGISHGVILRPSVTYGPFDRPGRMIPSYIMAAQKNEKLKVYGEGHQVRGWIHAVDVALGIIAAIERGKPGGIYNIAASESSVVAKIQVAKTILSLMGKSGDLIEHCDDSPPQMAYQVLNIKRTCRELGWEPKIGIKDGLLRTIEEISKG